METKSSGLAIVLSFFWTGLGQLYAGRIGRGLGMMALAPILWVTGWSVGFAGLIAAFSGKPHTGGFGLLGIVAGLMPLAYWVWGMLDARNLCESYNRRVHRGGIATPVQEYPAVRD